MILKHGGRRGLRLACMAALGLLAWAQQANIEVVTSYRVKPDRVGDFEAEVKEFNAVLKKAGARRGYTTWSTLSGPAAYVRVDIYENWAQLDEHQDPELKEAASDLTRLGMRIFQCTEGRERSIYTVRHDLSLEDAPLALKMIVLLRTRIHPEKIDEYVAAKKEYLALHRKAGAGFLAVLQGRYGASAREFVTIQPLENWAALDGQSALMKAVGPDELRQLGARLAAVEAERQMDVYRFEPDLSYFPAPGK